MGRILKGAVALVVAVVTVSQAAAQTLPPLLANFPAKGSDPLVEEAFADRVRSSFPRDIRTSTLSALLRMDGFSISRTEAGYAASFVQAEFPCITDYQLAWDESETGRVKDLRVVLEQKCV